MCSSMLPCKTLLWRLLFFTSKNTIDPRLSGLIQTAVSILSIKTPDELNVSDVKVMYLVVCAEIYFTYVYVNLN